MQKAPNSELPTSRAEAKSKGIKRYFTGKACPRGHVAARDVVNGTCVDCTAINVQKYNERYPEMAGRRSRAFHERNPEYAVEYSKKRYRDNLAKNILPFSDWRKNNPDAVRAIKSAWKKRNKARNAADAMKRFTAQRNACPSWADLYAIRAIYEECARVTESTGIKHHVDHIVPIRGKNVCGLHVHYNLQILEARANISKGNRLIPELIAA